MTSAREEILGRIRQATGGYTEEREREYAAIPREYVQDVGCNITHRIEMFVDRLQDYGCDVYRCCPGDIANTIKSVLSKRGKRRLIIPPGLSPDWQPNDVEFVSDNGLSYEILDNSEGVLTGCALAIASTGTIVLRHSPDEGRRATTLIPDYHLCVVFEQQLVGTVPEGIRAMSAFGSAPLTTISGPSATSDIEMTRIKGVHGPRTLDLILLSDDQT